MARLLYTLLLISTVALAFASRPLDSDEEITLYPAMGIAAEADSVIYVHGRVQDPEKDSSKRDLFTKTLRKLLNFDEHETQNTLFQQRAGLLLYDGENGVQFQLFGGEQPPVRVTSANSGFFQLLVPVPLQTQRDHIYSYHALSDDGRRFEGKSLQLASEGFSIISDVDDTVKITNVLNKKEMLRNTFLRDFKVVPGIASLYRQLLSQHLGLHFVSAGPFPLAPALLEFFRKENFPPHTLTMREISNLKDANQLTEGAENFKVPAIREIIKRYPKRKFLLVGDSGEKDPEVYSAILTEFPKQIIGIWIRNVTNEEAKNPRFERLFPGEKALLLKLFSDVSELPTKL